LGGEKKKKKREKSPGQRRPCRGEGGCLERLLVREKKEACPHANWPREKKEEKKKKKKKQRKEEEREKPKASAGAGKALVLYLPEKKKKKKGKRRPLYTLTIKGKGSRMARFPCTKRGDLSTFFGWKRGGNCSSGSTGKKEDGLTQKV